MDLEEEESLQALAYQLEVEHREFEEGTQNYPLLPDFDY